MLSWAEIGEIGFGAALMVLLANASHKYLAHFCELSPHAECTRVWKLYD